MISKIIWGQNYGVRLVLQGRNHFSLCGGGVGAAMALIFCNSPQKKNRDADFSAPRNHIDYSNGFTALPRSRIRRYTICSCSNIALLCRH